MAGYKHADLVKFLSKNEDAGQSAAADHLGITISQLPMIDFCRAQVEAGIWSEIAETPKAVLAARDKDGNRWELVAARADVGVAKAKTMYEDAGGVLDAKPAKTAKEKADKDEKVATRRGRKPSGTAGGRAASKKTGPQRARTRAERMARSGDPS
jgi:hypothetical protein